MDPIWILEIKTSDSVRGGSCSHLERQSKKAWTGREEEKEENGKFVEKETGIYRNKKSNY